MVVPEGSVGSINSRTRCVTPSPVDRSSGSSVGPAYFSSDSTSRRRSASPAHAASRKPARSSGSRLEGFKTQILNLLPPFRVA